MLINFLLTVYIDQKKYILPKDLTILSACQLINKFIPKFCFDPDLKIAGNCRMCLVEVQGLLNPITSCTFKIFNNIIIRTDSSLVRKSRENILEFLLINHPLDCPICDQGGECDLQDLSLNFGSDKSRFIETKKTVEDLPTDPFIKTVMTRCILCTKCVRFLEESTINNNLGIIGRGKQMEIGFFIKNRFVSEFSANIIDLCPVGALLLKPSSFYSRDWYIEKYYSFDIFDNICSDLIIHVNNNNIVKITPNINLNVKYISNFTRFFFDSLYFNRIKNIYFKNILNRKIAKISWVKLFKVLKWLFINNDSSNFRFILGELIDFNSIFSLSCFLNSKGIKDLQYCLNLNDKINGDFCSDYLINGKIDSGLFFLVGCNLSVENSSLNRVLQDRVNRGLIDVFKLGSNSKSTYKSVDLGISFKTLIDVLEGKHSLCKKIKKLKKNKKIVFFFGQEFLKVFGNSIINFIKVYYKYIQVYRISIGNNFFNFLEITGTTFLKIENEKIIYLYNTMYNIKNKKNKFLIYHGHHLTADALKSDLIIPCNNFLEKRNMFINVNGEIKRNKKIINYFFNNNDKILNENFIFSILNNNKNNKFKKIFFYLKDTKLYIFDYRICLFSFHLLPIYTIKTKITNKNIMNLYSSYLNNLNIILPLMGFEPIFLS